MARLYDTREPYRDRDPHRQEQVIKETPVSIFHGAK